MSRKLEIGYINYIDAFFSLFYLLLILLTQSGRALHPVQCLQRWFPFLSSQSQVCKYWVLVLTPIAQITLGPCVYAVLLYESVCGCADLVCWHLHNASEKMSEKLNYIVYINCLDFQFSKFINDPDICLSTFKQHFI